MLERMLLAAILAVTITACAAIPEAAQPTRLDATAAKSAEYTFNKMASEPPGDEWQQLSMAMIAINLKGVESAAEIQRNPVLQYPTIVRIKDEVAGMTAQEIIAYGDKVSPGRWEPGRK